MNRENNSKANQKILQAKGSWIFALQIGKEGDRKISENTVEVKSNCDVISHMMGVEVDTNTL